MKVIDPGRCIRFRPRLLHPGSAIETFQQPSGNHPVINSLASRRHNPLRHSHIVTILWTTVSNSLSIHKHAQHTNHNSRDPMAGLDAVARLNTEYLSQPSE